MKVSALLAAVPFETELIIPSLRRALSDASMGKRIVRGRLGEREMIVMCGGIGAVNAAHAATLLIERFSTDLIINAGIGGAYEGRGLCVGDVALATAEVFGDWGVAGDDGYGSFKKIGLPLVRTADMEYYNEFRLDGPVMRSSIETLQRDGVAGCKVMPGRFVTVAASSGSTGRAAEMAGLHDAVCENMEGAAVAQVCAIYGIDMIEIRGISNIAGIRDRRKWNMKRAAVNCQKVLMNLLEAGIL